MKHTTNWLKALICVALTVVLLSATASPALAVARSSTLATSGSRYSVIASALNVRTGAGTSYTVIKAAPRGTTMTFISERNGWWYVRLNDGTTGYVDKQYLTPLNAPSTGSYSVNVATLNVRSEPKTSAKRVGQLGRGTTISINKLNGDWGYSPSVGGWVALKYLSASSGSTPAATVSSGNVYTVIASRLNVRRSASASSTRLDTVAKGTSVRVTQVSGSWAYVTYTHSGSVRQGWVSVNYLG